MKNVKCILFDLNLDGRGVVNYDGKEIGLNRKYFGDKINGGNEWNKNFMFAKKVFYSDYYKLKISSNSLRNNMFREDISTSPSYASKDEILSANFAISEVGLLRGYLNANRDLTLNKKSGFSMTDAIQTCNAVSDLELFTCQGEKNENSLFIKETVGDIKYNAHGHICMDDLQFLSCSPYHGRQALKEDWITKNDMVYKLFEQHYGDVAKIKHGYYNCMAPAMKEAGAEFGVMLNNELVVFLVKKLLKRMMSIFYSKSGAVANVSTFKIKFVQDVTTNLRGDVDGDEWLELKTFEDIDALDFEMFNYYVESTTEDCEAFRRNFEKATENTALKKEEEKLNKNLASAVRKLKKEKEKDEKNEDEISALEIKISEIEDSLNNLKNK